MTNPRKKIIKAEIYNDEVNGWILNKNDIVFEYSFPQENDFFTENWSGGYSNFYPTLSLIIYKRKDNLNRIFYSFVLGYYEIKQNMSKWVAIDGFNLVKEQVKDIFK